MKNNTLGLQNIQVQVTKPSDLSKQTTYTTEMQILCYECLTHATVICTFGRIDLSFVEKGEWD